MPACDDGIRLALVAMKEEMLVVVEEEEEVVVAVLVVVAVAVMMRMHVSAVSLPEKRC